MSSIDQASESLQPDSQSHISEQRELKNHDDSERPVLSESIGNAIVSQNLLDRPKQPCEEGFAQDNTRNSNSQTFENVCILSPPAIRSDGAPKNQAESPSNYHTDDNLYDDEGNIVHLHQLPASILKLRDLQNEAEETSSKDDLHHFTNGSVISSRSNDNESASNGSPSDCSMEVTISHPDRTPNRAVLNSARNWKTRVVQEQSWDDTSFSLLDGFDVDLRKAPLTSIERTVKIDIACEDGDKREEGKCDLDQMRDDYVRSGARFRSLLDSAFRKVADGYTDAGALSTLSDGIRVDPMVPVKLNGKSTNRKRKGRIPVVAASGESIRRRDNSRPSRRRRLSLMLNRSRDDDVNDENTARESTTDRLAAALVNEKMNEVLTLQKVCIHAIEIVFHSFVVDLKMILN